MNIKIKKVKSVKDNSTIDATVKKANKKTGGSSLTIKIKRISSKTQIVKATKKSVQKQKASADSGYSPNTHIPGPDDDGAIQ